MKTKSLLLLVALLTTGALCASAATEEKIHETRAAQPGGSLVVDVDFGSIEVTPTSGNEVVVDARRSVEMSSKKKEEEYLAAIPMRITTEGNKIIVRAVRKDDSLGQKIWQLMDHVKTEAHYTIHTPVRFNIDLDTSGGDISATGLNGSVKADTSGGDLTFHQIQGDVHADTSGGHIEVVGGSGKVDGDTSGGNVTVKDRAGDTNVESNGGTLRLANVRGKLKAETSGGSISAILSSPVKDEVRLETSGGSITVLTPSNAGLDIDAETSAGRIQTDLPIARVKEDEDSLKGTLNGGGKLLRLRSSAGSIQIVAADKEVARQ